MRTGIAGINWEAEYTCLTYYDRQMTVLIEAHDLNLVTKTTSMLVQNTTLLIAGVLSLMK